METDNFLIDENTQRIYINEGITLDELCNTLVKYDIAENTDKFKFC